MELVTVLITCYNSEKWINECLYSLINQKYTNLQILIIDDGSDDRSVDLIKRCTDKRIELHCKEHSGISKSLNFAIDKIKGNYIARIDADDLCNPERIEKQMQFLNNNIFYGIVGSNFILIDENGREIQKVNNPENDVRIKDQLLRRCCVWNGSILMKKEILLSVKGYDENRISAEDWDLFIRLIGKTKFYNIQDYLSSKRFHKDNISLLPTAAKESESVLLKYNNELIQASDSDGERARGNFNIGYYFYYESKFEIANEYFSKAIKLSSFKFQIIRYFIISKYFYLLVRFSRKYRLYKVLDWLRLIDKNNKYLRNKF